MIFTLTLFISGIGILFSRSWAKFVFMIIPILYIYFAQSYVIHSFGGLRDANMNIMESIVHILIKEVRNFDLKIFVIIILVYAPIIICLTLPKVKKQFK